ncbi:proteoglycan 4-like [Hylaeus anthracinus]|uniref:proteoglycan 4-like n=1 Tax=Hylaeus anthracinus TaxID=313031 RepID=UPI0023B9F26D|nr:proteoglycan 4-like [Hylaeus anthracinus]
MPGERQRAKYDRTGWYDRTVSFPNLLPPKSQYSLGSSYANSSFGSLRGTTSRTFNMGLVCARNFTTASREPVRIVSLSKELTKYLSQQQRFFRNTVTMMNRDCGDKPSKPPPCDSGASKFAPDSPKSGQNQQRGSCRQPYERRKPCPSLEKCVPPSPPCCRPRPKNPKCAQLAQTCPPPCPLPCPKPPEKPPPPKICYRKCPPPPKLPKLPKCRKIPAPPPPPPPPPLPKLPKCPPPCPPPIPPPLPTCPRTPKCPECPPQKECPPPPPCEPCPCPLPCPPPCCPPPPPCPPCPPPIPCPRPLPCPPPPPPAVCPPCPPCPEHPKPPPCPPPPPCCPCPCPEPPPPPPCPKPCPPCPRYEQATCPKDVPSCPKCNNSGKGTKKRRMSTYCGSPLRLLPLGDVRRRKLHISCVFLGKPPKSNNTSKCKSMDDLCKTKTKGSCVKSCEKKSDCDTKRPVCEDQMKKDTKKKKKTKKKKEVCPDICIPRGKCELPHVAPPPKMQYGVVKCPDPKFATPTPCPDMLESTREDEPCEQVDSFKKQKKEVCVPPPLPKPPTEPVVLCPCPPPPKMHPGPCPCHEVKQEPPQKITMPPCPGKEKYVCPRQPHYCPQEKQICRMDKACDPSKRKNKKKKK